MTCQKKTKCATCPSAGGNASEALDRIHEMQAHHTGDIKGINALDRITRGCDWYINSKEYGYCWYEYKKTIDRPIPDEEIRTLLGINQFQLREISKSALNKLKNAANTPEMQELKELLKDKISADSRQRSTEYDLPSFGPQNGSQGGVRFSEVDTEESIQDDIDRLKYGRNRSRGGMPLHKDGKKTDLYGLYTDKSLEKHHGIKKEKPESGEQEVSPVSQREVLESSGEED